MESNEKQGTLKSAVGLGFVAFAVAAGIKAGCTVGEPIGKTIIETSKNVISKISQKFLNKKDEN